MSAPAIERDVMAYVTARPAKSAVKRNRRCHASMLTAGGTVPIGREASAIRGGSVLARNEEFSKIAVIKFFFTVLKKKIQLSVGGFSKFPPQINSLAHVC